MNAGRTFTCRPGMMLSRVQASVTLRANAPTDSSFVTTASMCSAAPPSGHKANGAFKRNTNAMLDYLFYLRGKSHSFYLRVWTRHSWRPQVRFPPTLSLNWTLSLLGCSLLILSEEEEDGGGAADPVIGTQRRVSPSSLRSLQPVSLRLSVCPSVCLLSVRLQRPPVSVSVAAD